MKPVCLAGIAMMVAGCGRLGFDVPLTAKHVAGSATADLELCGGPARYWITAAPVAEGWSAETFDEPGMAPLVLHAGETTAARCKTLPALRIRAEQIELYAYAMTSDGEQTAEATATMQPTWTREHTTAGDDGVTVWVHRPEAHYRDAGAPMPVLVFLHGWGHSTNVNINGAGVDTMPRDSGFLELFTQLKEDMPEENPLAELPFLVLAPNCVHTGDLRSRPIDCWGWKSGDIIYDEVMRYAGERFAIDEARIYVTGLSTGGEGAFRLAAARGAKPADGMSFVPIAAAVPIASTCTDPSWFTANSCGGSDVAIWAFHSNHDTNPTTHFDNSESLIATANDCARRAPAILSRGDWRSGAEGHAGWVQVYSDTHGTTNDPFSSIYPWLLAHARDPAPAP